MSKATAKASLFNDSEDESDGGAKLQVNKDFASRFEHNKKREELHRLEEKYKSQKPNGQKPKGDDAGSEEDSSSDESEDENGFLATEELDAEISATLNAIKNKDPRLYDGETTFYTPMEEANAVAAARKEKKDKPLTLHEYQRNRILAGDTGEDFDTTGKPAPTYAEEQAETKQDILNEIKAQIGAQSSDSDSDADETFIKAKPKKGTSTDPTGGVHPSRAGQVKTAKVSVEDADKDPELFLSNFMSSRAWVNEEDNKWKAFESDDEDDDKNDEWEQAYNLRFEDPTKSNEVLKSYARDVTAARSVRRDEKTARQKKRDREKEEKDAEKQQRKEERARLRRLKIEEAEDKIKKIKHAAGLSGKTLKEEDLQKFIGDSWDNDKWEEEMQRVFNEEYYAEVDENDSEDDDEEDGDEDGKKKKKKSKKLKKPTWDDDIDIKDIVSDFEDEERPNLSDDDNDYAAEQQEQQQDEDEDEEEQPSAKRQKTTRDRKKERLASQKEARKERAQIEALVDAKMNLDDPEILAVSSSSKSGGEGGGARFAYRETRPESFGLTTRDILMASDADLNTFAGLKKLAHFREADKQSKDRKKLGKKARLRQWRKDTFGKEFEHEPPAYNPGGDGKGGGGDGNEDESNIIEGGGSSSSSKKKRKRSKGHKKGKGAAA